VVFATLASHQFLREGQALAWNPTITGVKSEDSVLITAGVPEVLTRTPTWPQYAVRLADAPFDNGAEAGGNGGDAVIERPALVLR
jgi:hypothetical protein